MDALDVMSAFVDRAGFADAGMGDEHDVEVGEKRPAGFQPDLLFKHRGDGGDRGPPPEDLGGVKRPGLIYERLDPRFQAPLPAFGRPVRGSF